MRFTLLAFIFLLTNTLQVQASVQTCFQKEGFLSQTAHSTALKQWIKRRPPDPSFYKLERAYAFSYYESGLVNRLFKYDKAKHCLVGCRIAQDIDFETAEYAAWYKEYTDLIDCNSKSKFETLDYVFTLWGAYRGTESQDFLYCVEKCEMITKTKSTIRTFNNQKSKP